MRNNGRNICTEMEDSMKKNRIHKYFAWLLVLTVVFSMGGIGNLTEKHQEIDINLRLMKKLHRL